MLGHKSSQNDSTAAGTSTEEDTGQAPNGRVDWSFVQSDQGLDEDDRDVVVREKEMYQLVGLRDEDERANRSQSATNNPVNCGAQHADFGVEPCNTSVQDDTVGAAIPVDDTIPDEHHCVYDRDRPRMVVSCTFPSMKDFRMAVRQYAANKEFDMDIVKSDPSRFRGSCKVEGCPWRIMALLMLNKRTVRVSKMVDDHKFASTSRIKSSMASHAWITDYW